MYFETYSHFDGGIDLLSEKINRGKPFNPTENHTSIGIFTPQRSLDQYIATYFGKELMEFLQNDFDPGSLDDNHIEMSPVIRDQLLKIPIDWFRGYDLYKTAGLIIS